MTKISNKQKIKFWQSRLRQLETVEFPPALHRVGQAGVGGDWHENAEYEDAERQVEIIKSSPTKSDIWFCGHYMYIYINFSDSLELNKSCLTASLKCNHDHSTDQTSLWRQSCWH